MTFALPEPVLRKAQRARALDWVKRLPDLVADLEQEWDIAVGGSLSGGTEAFVAAALVADGTPAVLKLVLPQGRDGARHEITALHLARGGGCARLLRADSRRGALLLERLGPSLHELGLPFGARQQILADLAGQVWRPAADSGLTTGADKAAYLIEYVQRLWEELSRPCPRAAVDYAVRCARRRQAAHDEDRAVLVHGDIHQWNALRRNDGGYALIDPDGLLAEKEYDLGVLLREDPEQVLDGGGWRWCSWLAERTGTDPRAIWEWGAIERVSTGLLLSSIGMTDLGEAMLAAAQVAAGRPPC